MRFTFAVAGIAAVASAIKIQQDEPEAEYFEESYTLHCNDCDVVYSYNEPAKGSADQGEEVEEVVEVAESKEW